MDRGPIGPPINERTRKPCSVVGCDTLSRLSGMCIKHFQRWKKHGDTSRTDVEWDPVKRFEAGYIVTASGCWEWQGGDTNQFGHGRFTVRGKRVGVHRWAYEHFIGPIPDGLVIDHVTCRNPPCVNPAHLEPVTQPVNVARAPTAITTINAAKTYCVHGHPLSGANLGIGRNGTRPCRYCRTCQRAAERRYQARKRAMR